MTGWTRQRDRRRSDGQCAGCGRDSETWYCEDCRQHAIQKRRAKVATGICVGDGCENKVTVGRMCFECRRKTNERQRKRYAERNNR